MNALLNDCFRFTISVNVRILGAVLTLLQQFGIRFFNYSQNQLEKKYGITDQTPILSYGFELTELIDEAASGKRGHLQFPMTSGSTGFPKRVLFTNLRLRLLKLIFSDFFVRCCWSFSIRRTNLYVFSANTEDASLTSMLLEEKRMPSYFSTLQAPYRIQSNAALKALASEYGVTALRLWILTLSNPGVLYSTNPSTLSTFFDDLEHNWESGSRLVRDWHGGSTVFDPTVRRIARRLCSVGYRRRIEAVAISAAAVSLEVYAPAVRTYICWTGGYVKPFLQRLEKHLPRSRYQLIPMYSMSTESVETIGHVRGAEVSFLPIAPGVLYEFAETDTTTVLKPHQLIVGHTYSLIVSDNYGLRRYDTGDLFLCRQKIFDLPDLTFLRRRDLEYSFTGEKLTAHQLTCVFDQLRATNEGLRHDHFLSCIPSHPSDDAIPHYKIMLVSIQPNGAAVEGIANDCDRLLTELNCEYKAKRETGRLGPMRFLSMNQADFINLTSGCGQSHSWEAQFKFLPLYVQTWEAMNNRIHLQIAQSGRWLR